ncbi:hypothetical protein PAPYR_4257 [Paratrimastix pyriformis]|uniref:N-glycosylase/DNA lyase n=1 Tax=Paratrimastix pyriformis TaxID=342808 RepID=A0ABQ8UPA4_9EUKA|nr:hypothetical protein PAPYR_4257 [Paratrimastix pyriformis]
MENLSPQNTMASASAAPAPTINLSPRLIADFRKAREFAERTHRGDVEWIQSRTTLVELFDDFFEEYVYVVVASGFRAIHAARLCPQLIACRGNVPKMLKVFGNQKKVEAIGAVWRMRSKWPALRKSFTSVDSLTQLPRIGPIVKFHLARNIGIRSVGKPDLHLVRYASALGYPNCQEMVEALAQHEGLAPGSTDFILWIWLSHNRGKENTCCHDGYKLR